MAHPKTRSKRQQSPRPRRRKSVPTTEFMTNAAAARPKAAASFKFRSPAGAVTFPASKPWVKPLLQGYGEAFGRSHEIGRPVSFRVQVDPDGGATVIDEKTTTVEPLPIEEVKERDPALEEALAAARERGRTPVAEVLARDDMLSAEALAERLGTTRVTVNTKRRNGQLLGLDGARRGFRFPVWQINAEGKPYSELPALLERLGGPWAVYRFLVQSHGALGGLTGRQALERARARK
jgi:hypothetical protein